MPVQHLEHRLVALNALKLVALVFMLLDDRLLWVVDAPRLLSFLQVLALLSRLRKLAVLRFRPLILNLRLIGDLDECVVGLCNDRHDP